MKKMKETRYAILMLALWKSSYTRRNISFQQLAYQTTLDMNISDISLSILIYHDGESDILLFHGEPALFYYRVVGTK